MPAATSRGSWSSTPSTTLPAIHGIVTWCPLPWLVANGAWGVRVYTCIWQADGPRDIDLVHVPVSAMTMAAREARFHRWIAAALRDTGAACAVGFDASGMVVDALPATDLATDVPPGTAARPVPPQAERGALRARFAFAADDVVFVMLGGDLVVQGIERLFVAVGKLPTGLRDRCRILALGRLPRSFGAAVRELGLAERTRIVEDGLSWRDAIEAGDVFVGLPYAASSNGWVFDAMAAGRIGPHPCVATPSRSSPARPMAASSWPRRSGKRIATARLPSWRAMRTGDGAGNATLRRSARFRPVTGARRNWRDGSICWFARDRDSSAHQARYRAPLPA